jgi:uncharacterized NAD-dependent epimerase/dehydratase family protein
MEKRRMVLLTEGRLGTFTSKTAASLVRYKPDEVVAVLDSAHAGERIEDILEIGYGIPIVATLQEALAFHPTCLVIGIATPGGVLPPEWRAVIVEAIRHRLEIVNGLHTFLTEDEELVRLAADHGVRLWDVRQPPADLDVGRHQAHRLPNLRVLTVGADSSIGKMVAAIEITRAARQAGWDAEFVATGQTGIMIEGSGIAVDTVVADFISGAVERLVMERKHREMLVIEGQGTILHPSYSGVSLGLLHGAAPQALVLCHQPGRDFLRNLPVKIPPFSDLVHLHETVARALFPCEVVAISLNCAGMSLGAARQAVDAVHRETGLPTTDCVKFGCDPILEALQPFRKRL